MTICEIYEKFNSIGCLTNSYLKTVNCQSAACLPRQRLPTTKKESRCFSRALQWALQICAAIPMKGRLCFTALRERNRGILLSEPWV